MAIVYLRIVLEELIFQGGNHNELIQSIKMKLFNLPDSTVVYTGHGNDTQIEKEKRENPFLQ